MIGSSRISMLSKVNICQRLCAPLRQPIRYIDLNSCNEGILDKMGEKEGDANLTLPEFKSMWLNPDCCPEAECENFRHDTKYLKPRTDRKYTRTWNECDEYPRRKVMCCTEILPPEVEVRPRRREYQKGSSGGICEGDASKLDLMPCVQKVVKLSPCPRITMPRCKEAKIDRCGARGLAPKCCQKRCTLYPSYSECDRQRPLPPLPVECNCLKTPSMCEVYQLFRKLAIK